MTLWNILKKKKKITPPELGQRVQITWLPTNVEHIGGTGTVRCVYEDGSFDLQYDSGGWLVVGTRYKYEIIG